MKKNLLVFATLIATPTFGAATVADQLMAEYRAGGKATFSAAEGERLWTRESTHEGAPRSCASCHTKDLRVTGKHASTGKPIEPLAPSANRTRLTDPAKVEKWFARNCKWALGRACTPEEKGHFLAFIQSR